MDQVRNDIFFNGSTFYSVNPTTDCSMLENTLEISLFAVNVSVLVRSTQKKIKKCVLEAQLLLRKCRLI